MPPTGRATIQDASRRRQARLGCTYAHTHTRTHARTHTHTNGRDAGLKGRWYVHSKSGKYVAEELSSAEADALVKNLEDYSNYMHANREVLRFMTVCRTLCSPL